MVIVWHSGVFYQLKSYYGPMGYAQSGSFSGAIWTYDPNTGIVCVTVSAPGTFCHEIGTVGTGGSYLRRR